MMKVGRRNLRAPVLERKFTLSLIFIAEAPSIRDFIIRAQARPNWLLLFRRI